MPVKTLKFNRDELALLVRALDLWYNSGEYERDEMPSIEYQLARLRKQLGDLNYNEPK